MGRRAAVVVLVGFDDAVVVDLGGADFLIGALGARAAAGRAVRLIWRVRRAVIVGRVDDAGAILDAAFVGCLVPALGFCLTGSLLSLLLMAGSSALRLSPLDCTTVAPFPAFDATDTVVVIGVCLAWLRCWVPGCEFSFLLLFWTADATARVVEMAEEVDAEDFIFDGGLSLEIYFFCECELALSKMSNFMQRTC